jgi:hypothetical protein
MDMESGPGEVMRRPLMALHSPNAFEKDCALCEQPSKVANREIVLSDSNGATQRSVELLNLLSADTAVVQRVWKYSQSLDPSAPTGGFASERPKHAGGKLIEKASPCDKPRKNYAFCEIASDRVGSNVADPNRESRHS